MEDAKDCLGSRGWAQIVVAGILTLVVLSLTIPARGKIFRKRPFPPGPLGWPVFGSLLLLGTLPHQAIDKLSNKYGPIMFMHLGSMPTLVASNSQMAEAILKTKDHIMASRPDLIAGRKLFYNLAGMGFTPYGPQWRYLRRACIQEILTTHRINRFQDIRRSEVMAMLHSMIETAEQGNVVIVNEFLFNVTMNNLTQMLFNKSYCSVKRDSESKEAIAFREITREILDLAGEFNLADYIPILKHFDLQGYNKRSDVVHEKMDKFLESILLEHDRTKLLTGTQENFVDALLAVSIANEAGFEDRLSRDNVKALLMEMIIAGTDTSATASEWVLSELVKHPTMLQRAQEELDLVVGKFRLVDEADLPNLKYIQAVVKETFRFHPIAPLVFDPERFLGSMSTTDVKGKSFELLPFGSGRRMCPGMNLGLLIVQYVLAQMLHTIDWAVPQAGNPRS